MKSLHKEIWFYSKNDLRHIPIIFFKKLDIFHNTHEAKTIIIHDFWEKELKKKDMAVLIGVAITISILMGLLVVVMDKWLN